MQETTEQSANLQKGTSENLNRSPILRLDKDKQVQVTSSCLIMKLHPVHDTHCITLQSCMHHISEANCISIWHIQRSLDCCGDFILDFTCKPGSHLENHGIQRDEPQKPSQIHLQTSHLHPAPQWSWVKQWWFYFPEAEMLWVCWKWWTWYHKKRIVHVRQVLTCSTFESSSRSGQTTLTELIQRLAWAI